MEPSSTRIVDIFSTTSFANVLKTFGIKNGTKVYHVLPGDRWRALTNVVEVKTIVVAMVNKIVAWQRFESRSAKWTVGAKFWTTSSDEIVRMQKKHTVFMNGRGNIIVANWWRAETVAGVVDPTISGSCSTDNSNRNDTANVDNILKTTMVNWHITTNDVCTRFVCVLTRNPINDH